jgi:[ribosomal protein S5]-alanine N-acetyltransferase
MRSIKTDRLIIRHYTTEDISAMVEMLNDKIIHRFTTVPYPYTKKMATSFAKKRDKNNLHFGIFRKSDNTLVGGVGLKDVDHKTKSAELGYLCHRKHRNKGYVTEASLAVLKFAFNDLKLKRIEVDCNINNSASRKVIKKLGAKYEGTLRNAIPWKSSWEHKLVHSILKEEFIKQNNTR